MRLIMIDLDGTLFDTKKVNYMAYQEAVSVYGYKIDYTYYCKFCNGRHYLDFLPQITTSDEKILDDIHRHKKEIYKKYISYAVLNKPLVDIIRMSKLECKIALITTASSQNTYDILNEFGIFKLFDLILTQDQVIKPKPDPEGYLKAMEYFGVAAEDSLIFEDSAVGIEAAERSGAHCFVVKGYN